MSAVAPSIAVIFAAGVYAQPIQIASFGDLCKIGVEEEYPLDTAYELAGDIDASASRGQNDGKGFEPIGKRVVTHMVDGSTEVLNTAVAFRGSFDGKGFKIHGLYISRSGEDGVGLFGYAHGAEIRNVSVIADSVIGGRYVGALVGRVGGGTVNGCYAGGVVVGNADAGGLAGAIERVGEDAAVLTASYSSANVSGVSMVGGLVGSNEDANISWCYTTGAVSGVSGGQRVGGLVGYNAASARVESCYSLASVSGAGASTAGGFVGENAGSARITMSYSAGAVSGGSGFAGSTHAMGLLYCYLDTERSGQTASADNLTGKTSAEMIRAATYVGWFAADTMWGISNCYPYLKKLPVDTVTFTVKPGGGTVGGDPVHVQMVNRGVDGVGVAAGVSAADGGESFDGWYLAGVDEKLVSGSYAGFTAALSGGGDTIAISGLSGSVGIEARFTMKTYTLTYVAVANGKVRMENEDPSTARDTVVVPGVGHGQLAPCVVAVPNTGYRFARWGSPGTNDTNTVRADTAWGDTVILARFTTNTLTVRYATSDPDIGVLTVNGVPNRVNYGPGNVQFGKTGPKVEAVPLSRYHFVMWSDSLTDNPRVDSLLRDSVDVFAMFAANTLAYTAGDGGKIAVEGRAGTLFDVFVDTVEYNRSGSRVTAVPDSGYKFVMWSDNREDSSRIDSLGRRDTAFTAAFEKITDAVKSSDRVIPNTLPNGELAIARPLTITAGGFAAGPNPVSRQSGLINFFWNGKLLDNSVLFIYDVTGNIAGRISVSDNIIHSNAGKRKVASWDLTDGNGRAVSEGTYLVRGTLLRKDGKEEKVSIILGVR